MNYKKLYRNTNRKVFGGVASGLADYFEIDVILVRVLFVLGFFIPTTLPIIILYIVLWIAVPNITKKPKELSEPILSSQ